MLRLSECYASFQGEGPNTGKPTVFVRFAGCNFKCAGWPCDTPHAIDPKIFTKEQEPIMPSALASRIVTYEIQNICITGGEPFLQNNDDLHELVQELVGRMHTVEAFTNGSLVWSPTLIDLFRNIILDWKLPGSEEFPDEGTLFDNIRRLNADDAVKFTVKHEDDFGRAQQNYDWIRNHIAPNRVPQIWCGPVWNGIDIDKACVDSATIAAWILAAKLPWHLNTQVHKYVWGAETRGV